MKNTCRHCGKDAGPLVLPAPIMLRDEFAGRALEGFCCNSNVEINIHDAAEISYKIADAMLAARDRGIENKGEVGP